MQAIWDTKWIHILATKDPATASNDTSVAGPQFAGRTQVHEMALQERLSYEVVNCLTYEAHIFDMWSHAIFPVLHEPNLQMQNANLKNQMWHQMHPHAHVQNAWINRSENHLELKVLIGAGDPNMKSLELPKGSSTPPWQLHVMKKCNMLRLSKSVFTCLKNQMHPNAHMRRWHDITLNGKF